MLSPAEQDRVNAAVAEAEHATSGEIFCIVARRTSSYAETPLAYAAGAALLLPLGVVAFGHRPWDWAGGWRVAAMAPEQAVFAYALVQALVFLVVLGLTAIPAVRLRLAPKPLKRARVHRAAVQQFLAKGLHLTAARTGVLIFASEAERHAEIVADEGIHAKVAPEVWAEALEALMLALRRGDPAGGFVEAVRLTGGVLAPHFPARAGNPNELPDRIVQI